MSASTNSINLSGCPMCGDNRTPGLNSNERLVCPCGWMHPGVMGISGEIWESESEMERARR